MKSNLLGLTQKALGNLTPKQGLAQSSSSLNVSGVKYVAHPTGQNLSRGLETLLPASVCFLFVPPTLHPPPPIPSELHKSRAQLLLHLRISMG